MIMGPLAAWLLKQFDRATQDRVAVGFEMLVANFSLGILGAVLAVLGLLAIGPVVDGLSTFLRTVVEGTVKAGVLPLVSIFIEPGKVLFLNNAINHGVLDTRAPGSGCCLRIGRSARGGSVHPRRARSSSTSSVASTRSTSRMCWCGRS